SSPSGGRSESCPARCSPRSSIWTNRPSRSPAAATRTTNSPPSPRAPRRAYDLLVPRSIWSGAIAFGLVNVPVQLYTAVAPKEIRFHLLHEKDGGRIHLQRVCSIDDAAVPWNEITKGYVLSRGRHVLVSAEELEAIDPKATHTIDIDAFVDLDEIDPIYFESTYHVVPEEGAARAYALLLEAMEKQKKIAVATMVLRTKQHLACLRPMGKGL